MAPNSDGSRRHKGPTHTALSSEIREAHGYKNLRTVSNIEGVGVEGSQRASDLDMKLGYLRERHGGRVATFATATPIANSVAEAYTMQRFLRPDLLDEAGLTDFDTWAATFGEVTSDLELAPDGSRFRMKSRFAKFRNVPELLRIWHVSADIKTAEDLQLPTPDLRNGRAETVVVPATEQLTAFMGELSERADKVQSRAVPSEEDNMLKVATHGRMAALDLRLLGRDPGEDAKLTAAANRIAATHHTNAERTYGDSEVAGSLQLVFSDLGTPNARSRTGAGLAGGWNVYDELKAMLVDRGVPAERVRFVHDAHNDKEKGELFAACRNGRVAVLLGSTEKMGVGTNVQARAVALHHLDCPWRPADIAQREGRILRQGNLNPEVEVIRYVSEGSFDAYLWQTVERKARFIGQVMRGSLDVREIEDVGEAALSYSEVKALATGDPRILEKAKVDAEATRLERLERSHGRNQRTLSGTIDRAEKALPGLEAARDQLDQAIGRRVDTGGDRFAMTVGSNRWSGRADAAVALRNALAAIGGSHPDTTQFAAWDKPNHIGNLGGFDVIATPRRFLEPHLSLELAGIPRSTVRVDFDELRNDRPLGIVVKLENRIGDLERTRHLVDDEHAALAREADRARDDYGQPFTRAEALQAARARSAELAAELAEQDKQRDQQAATRADATPTAAAVAGATRAGDPGPNAAPTAPSQSRPAPAGAPSARDWSAQPPRSPDEHAQMARDTAAATFAAGTPIVAMDRPSVERELRHAHGDTTRYTTAHAARDALTAARADTPAAPSQAPPAETTAGAAGTSTNDTNARHQVQATYSGQRMYVTFAVDLDLKMRVELQSEPADLSARNVERLLRRIAQDPSLTDITVDGQPNTGANPAAATTLERVERQDVLEQTPPGGWTEADRVRPAQPRDTSSYRSAQQFPAGTALTVHAIGEDGPGRQLGHGVVVDHPGPEHVTVESPYGSRRISPISHGRPADPRDPTRPADPHDPTRPADPHDPTRPARPAAAPSTAPLEHRGPAEVAAARWEHLFRDSQPQILDDPHWPTLAAQLDRIATTGADVGILVDQVIAERTLPADNPARSLDYRLANAVPPATGPRPRLDTDPPAASRPAPPPPQQGHHRSGPPR